MATLPDLRRRDGKDSKRMIYEYYVVIMYDTPLLKRSCAGLCYKLDYKLDSTENIIKFADILKNEGYQTPVVLFFKQLNEYRTMNNKDRIKGFKSWVREKCKIQRKKDCRKE